MLKRTLRVCFLLLECKGTTLNEQRKTKKEKKTEKEDNYALRTRGYAGTSITTCYKWWMPAPLLCVGQGEQASSPTVRAFTQHRGNLRVTPALCITSPSMCLKTNTKNGKPRLGQCTEHTRQKHWRWHLCYRSIHPSVTHTCSLFLHSITVCRHVGIRTCKARTGGITCWGTVVS